MDSRGPKTADRPDPGTVLVVEDDDATRAFLLDNLAADGFRVGLRRAVVALWAAASSNVPVWTPWLVPAGLAVVFLIAWQQESDNEPHGGAVVAMVGLAAVALVSAAILVGYVVRRKRSE